MIRDSLLFELFDYVYCIVCIVHKKMPIFYFLINAKLPVFVDFFFLLLLLFWDWVGQMGVACQGFWLSDIVCVN